MKPAIMISRFPLGKLILFTFQLILSLSACCQNPTKINVLKNDLLPKDIILNQNIKEIIDSVFIIKNGISSKESVQVYLLNDEILNSCNHQNFVNDTLVSISKTYCDNNGNQTEIERRHLIKSSIYKAIRTLDDYGNKVILKVDDNGRTNILEYKNEYRNQLLVKVTMTAKKSGNILQTTNYKYDSNGNLNEECEKNTYWDVKNIYAYNKSNQIISYKHFINSILEDSILYYYTAGLLSQKITYHSNDTQSYPKLYKYNDNEQLISESDVESKRDTLYKEYDNKGNWTVQQIIVDGVLGRVTKRSFR